MANSLITRVLDGAILLAVVTQAVSLSDFFLLPAQKKKIEVWCDELTLRLNYVNTARWLQRWLQASRRAKLGAHFFAAISGLSIIGVPIYGAIRLFSTGFGWSKLIMVLVTLFSMIITWFYAAKVFDSVGKDVFESLAKAKTVFGFSVKFVAHALLGLFLISGAGLVLGLVGPDLRENFFLRNSLLQMAGSFYLGLIATWVAVFLDGVITLTVATLLVPGRVVVQASRAFMWRVSSYPKGPVAAITAIAVAILVIIRLSLY